MHKNKFPRVHRHHPVPPIAQLATGCTRGCFCRRHSRRRFRLPPGVESPVIGGASEGGTGSAVKRRSRGERARSTGVADAEDRSEKTTPPEVTAEKRTALARLLVAAGAGRAFAPRRAGRKSTSGGRVRAGKTLPNFPPSSERCREPRRSDVRTK